MRVANRCGTRPGRGALWPTHPWVLGACRDEVKRARDQTKRGPRADKHQAVGRRRHRGWGMGHEARQQLAGAEYDSESLGKGPAQVRTLAGTPRHTFLPTPSGSPARMLPSVSVCDVPDLGILGGRGYGEARLAAAMRAGRAGAAEQNTPSHVPKHPVPASPEGVCLAVSHDRASTGHRSAGSQRHPQCHKDRSSRRQREGQGRLNEWAPFTHRGVDRHDVLLRTRDTWSSPVRPLCTRPSWRRLRVPRLCSHPSPAGAWATGSDDMHDATVSEQGASASAPRPVKSPFPLRLREPGTDIESGKQKKPQRRCETPANGHSRRPLTRWHSTAQQHGLPVASRRQTQIIGELRPEGQRERPETDVLGPSAARHPSSRHLMLVCG